MSGGSHATRSPEEVSAVVRNVLALPLHRLTLTRLIDDTNPEAGVAATVEEAALNGSQTLHAGAIATLLEMTAYLALLPSLARDQDAVTHAFSASYLHAGNAGDELRCTASVTHRSRRLAFVDARLRREEELLATATVTKSIIRTKSDDVASPAGW